MQQQWPVIRRDWMLNMGNSFVILLERIIIIGFFGKKFDWWLFLCPIVIHIAPYFFSDVLFMELLVLDFALLSSRQLQYIGKIWPLLLYPKRLGNKNSGTIEASAEAINIVSK